MLTINDIQMARSRIQGHARNTPLLNAPRIDAALGFRAVFKAECLQITGAFKYRGAYNRIAALPPSERSRGVIAYSSGNHAQAVAKVATDFGIQSTIIMPEDAPKIKRQNTAEYGANVITYDRKTQSREDIAANHQGNAILIPPFDDEYVMAGQGTIGLEILDEIQPDILLCPTGGGGLLAGISTVLSPAGVACFGVEPEGFDDLARSLAAGEIQSNMQIDGSICDAILTPSPGQLTFPILQKQLTDVHIVSDQDVRCAIRMLANEMKLVVEPGGAVAMAAAIKNRTKLANKTVLIVLSGGNIDPNIFANIMAECDENLG